MRRYGCGRLTTGWFARSANTPALCLALPSGPTDLPSPAPALATVKAFPRFRCGAPLENTWLASSMVLMSHGWQRSLQREIASWHWLGAAS